MGTRDSNYDGNPYSGPLPSWESPTTYGCPFCQDVGYNIEEQRYDKLDRLWDNYTHIVAVACRKCTLGKFFQERDVRYRMERAQNHPQEDEVHKRRRSNTLVKLSGDMKDFTP